MIRLQKFLSTAGVCSRRKGEAYIVSGRIKVNGKVVTELGTKIDPDKDVVEFEGNPVEIKKHFVYIALNKPPGYVSSCRHKNDKIVLDLIEDITERVYPIGRLDKQSTGLILLTNDGSLHQALSHPSFDHEKEYDVTLATAVTDDELDIFASGIELNGRKTRPAKVQRISRNRFRVTLQEGRNRQIRRMAEKIDNHVDRLKRIRISTIRLGTLGEGKWRFLKKEEVSALKNRGVSSA